MYFKIVVHGLYTLYGTYHLYVTYDVYTIKMYIDLMYFKILGCVIKNSTVDIYSFQVQLFSQGDFYF